VRLDHLDTNAYLWRAVIELVASERRSIAIAFFDKRWAYWIKDTVPGVKEVV
jgi:hypothetical protein